MSLRSTWIWPSLCLTWVLACCAPPAVAAAADPDNGSPPGGQADPEADAILKQTIADAKALAADSLPDRKQIGEDWKLPWEAPPVAAEGVKTEEEYWQQAGQKMGVAGVSEAYARKLVDTTAAQLAAAGEGLTARDGIITLLLYLAAPNTPTALKICDGWEAGARALAVAEAQAAKGLTADPVKGARAAMDLIAAPYAGQSDEQLKQLFVRKITLIEKRTEMTYMRSNDWNALANARSEQELADKGVWLGVVKVSLMFADPKRTDEPMDLKAEDAPKLEARLSKAVTDAARGGMAMQRRQVEKEIERATARGDARAAEKLQEKLRQETAAAGQLAAKVVMRKFGDNSYVVRITGVSPDTVGMRFGMYTAWLRKGPAMCEISMGGNFPEAEMNKAMDTFLSEMDAKLASYDSFMYRALEIEGAEPPATKPSVATQAATPSKPPPPPPPPATRAARATATAPATVAVKPVPLPSTRPAPTIAAVTTQPVAGRARARPATVASRPARVAASTAPIAPIQLSTSVQQVRQLRRDLEERIDPKAGFTPELFERLEGALARTDPSVPQDRQLLQRARQFADGKLEADLFVPYLEKALAGERGRADGGDKRVALRVTRAPVAEDTPDEETNQKWKRAAEAGDVEAMRELGTSYYYGTAGEANPEEAMKWLKRAADAGDDESLSMLGAIYETERAAGRPHDEAEALRWTRKGAEAGHRDAMHALGMSYQDGRGTKRDLAEAMHWFRKAADLGHPRAMYQIGYLFENGLGVERDEERAADWYRKAAEAGDDYAKTWLADRGGM
jgi:hypothetical protein